MKHRATHFACMVALASPGVVVSTRAQSPDPLRAAANAPAVELPPMLVAETADAPPWFFASVNGTEYLSRCSSATTREYVEHWERALQKMWTMVPDRLLPRRDLAAITILQSQRLVPTKNPELLEALKRSAVSTPRLGDVVGDFGGDTFFRFAPNMRLNDRDGYATFAYLDEINFSAERMTVAPALLRFLLQRRVPALPSWFIEGTLEVYRNATFAPAEVSLAPLFWVDRVQTNGLALNAEHPRALLPANELFAHDVLRGPVNGNFQRRETVAAQAALFVRWALEAGPEVREALWRFAERCAEAPPSEELFTTCFGFGYSELRDRLSDFLPLAVKQPGRFASGKPGRLPRISVRRATPGEIARLRGGWERLAAAFVRQQSPQLHAPYVQQARATLRRAFEAGDRDPRLLRELGLCEVEAGDIAAAMPYLEMATAAAGRPGAHYELARLRYEGLRRDHPDKLFSAVELAPVLIPLRGALRQPPPLPEAYALFAHAWLRCSDAPAEADVALLEAGARAFPRQTEISLLLGRALARVGHLETAARLFALGAEYAADAATRARFSELQSSLAAPASR